METNTNTEMLRTAALKRADANFETAPRAGRVKAMTWLVIVVVALILALHAGIVLPALWKKSPVVFWRVLALDAGIVLICVAAWFISNIRRITLSGQTLLIKLTFWTARFDLAGLRSASVDAQAFKFGTLRSFGNGGLGAYHGWFWSKRMGKFRGYVTDKSRAVVLRWENKCVVVSPKDTEYFIEEVCKRTGARRQD